MQTVLHYILKKWRHLLLSKAEMQHPNIRHFRQIYFALVKHELHTSSLLLLLLMLALYAAMLNV